MMRLTVALACCAWLVVALSTAYGQAAGEAVVTWSFNDGDSGWQMIDGSGPVPVTQDAQVLREGQAGGVLEYSFTATKGQVAAIVAPIEGGLEGGRSLRLWMRTSEPTMTMVVLAEADETRYSRGFMSLPGAWQEIALDLGGFALDNDSRDENGKLDLDQVRNLALLDMTPMFAQLAEQVTFLVPPELGPRILWLDDVAVSKGAVAPRWEAVEIDGKPAVRLDGFERTPLEWFMLSGKGIEAEYDSEFKAEGEFSLRVQYDIPPDKLWGMMTSPAGLPLAGTQALHLAVMSEAATTLYIELKEADESKYGTAVPLEAGEQFETLEIALDQLQPGDDSTDENGKLDIDQVKELTIADISLMSGTPVTANTLWFDDVAFVK